MLHFHFRIKVEGCMTIIGLELISLLVAMNAARLRAASGETAAEWTVGDYLVDSLRRAELVKAAEHYQTV